MFDEVINHMTTDELRNYVKHCNELTEKAQKLCFSQQELLTAWKEVVTDMEYSNDCLLRRNKAMCKLRGLERELTEKYDEFVPKPMCSCERKEE